MAEDLDIRKEWEKTKGIEDKIIALQRGTDKVKKIELEEFKDVEKAKKILSDYHQKLSKFYDVQHKLKAQIETMDPKKVAALKTTLVGLHEDVKALKTRLNDTLKELYAKLEKEASITREEYEQYQKIKRSEAEFWSAVSYKFLKTISATENLIKACDQRLSQ